MTLEVRGVESATMSVGPADSSSFMKYSVIACTIAAEMAAVLFCYA